MITISLDGQIAIVTGASQGIGQACAVRLAEAGVKGLTITDIKITDSTRETQAQAEAFGAEVLVIPADVSKVEDWDRIVAETMARWGRIDILSANAGIGWTSEIFDVSIEQWDRVISVNLRGIWIGLQKCAEVMKNQGGGCIINMASIAGVTGGNTGPDYGASKSGVVGLTKFASKKLGKYNIRVNAVAPGTIDTQMVRDMYANLTPEQLEKRLSTIPMTRLGTADEVAKTVVFLASDLASYVHGEILGVTGGRYS